MLLPGVQRPKAEVAASPEREVNGTCTCTVTGRPDGSVIEIRLPETIPLPPETVGPPEVVRPDEAGAVTETEGGIVCNPGATGSDWAEGDVKDASPPGLGARQDPVRRHTPVADTGTLLG